MTTSYSLGGSRRRSGGILAAHLGATERMKVIANFGEGTPLERHASRSPYWLASIHTLGSFWEVFISTELLM